MRAAAVLALVLISGCNVILGIGDPHLAGDDSAIDANPNAIDADPNAPDANPNAIDANPNAIDAATPPPDAPGGVSGCIVGGPACNDCVDNDADAEIDGFDLDCTSAVDNDEGSLDDGIPESGNTLDCFFDGDGGTGNDDCAEQQCCPTTPGCNSNCPSDSGACLSFCVPITMPGCDCFGCCTLCDVNGCVDVELDPRVSPSCDRFSIHDPTQCTACTKTTSGCEAPCDPASCQLCPGQTAADLPGSCGGVQDCGGRAACTQAGECGPGMWCSHGCCISAAP